MTTPSEAAKNWAEENLTTLSGGNECEGTALRAFDAGVAHARAEWEGEKEKVREYLVLRNRKADSFEEAAGLGEMLEHAEAALPSWAKE